MLRRPGQPPPVRAFGALTLLVAALGLISHELVSAGILAVSPEFGLTMVQGLVGRVGLASLLAGSCLAAAIGWHVARASAAWPSRWRLLTAIGLSVGLLAATRLVSLDIDDPLVLRVYSYDVWWPFPLVWLSICLVEAGTTIVRWPARPWRWWATTVVVAAISLRALRQRSFADPHSQVMWALTFVASVLPSLGLTVVCLRDCVKSLRHGRWHWPPARWPTLRESTLLLALLLVSFGIASPFVFYIRVEPGLALSAFIIGWTLAAEVLAGGPLRALADTVVVPSVPRARMRLAQWWTDERLGIAQVAKAFATWTKDLTSVTSWPTAVLKALLLAIVLITISELPNARKTIIQPFSTGAPPGHDTFGKAISDRLFYELGLLNQRLQPATITPERAEGRGVKYLEVRADASALNTALGDVKDIDIGEVHIPMQLFFTPVQIPVRAFLNVRVVGGNLQTNGDRYTLLATATTGATWSASTPRVATTRSARDSVALNDAAARLAEQLAFKIMSTDPHLSPLGMTTSWEAFQSFSIGLAAWGQFAARQDADPLTWDSLTKAIANLREATKRDPAFALAHYRLGVALQKDGQPMAAAQAFEAALRVDPHFVAGYNALAYHLFYFDNYYFTTPGMLRPHKESDPVVRRARLAEASRLWKQVTLLAEASDPDWASAYNGLCLHALETKQYSAAYFYCKRAARLYAGLPPLVLSDRRLADAQAAILDALGVVLENAEPRRDTVAQEGDWTCRARVVDSIGATRPPTLVRSAYAQAARRYYERALALQPNDLVVRCNAASTAYLLGDKHPMQTLESTSEAHQALAEGYVESTRWPGSEARASAYYRLALAEYRRALALEPTNVLALNGYGDTFWNWRLKWPGSKEPTFAMARQAESYARNAVTLTTTQGSWLEPTVRSTLAEVLLAQARSHEALRVLQHVIDSLAPRHSVYDEVRWALAEANICAAIEDEQTRPGEQRHISALRDRAASLLEDIRRSEQIREDRPFTQEPHALDPARSQLTCHRDLAPWIPRDSAVSYALSRGGARYSPHSFCGWLGVMGDAYDALGDPVSAAYLHVWGPEVDGRILVGDHPRDAILLAPHPWNSHGEYFAQLEYDSTKAVSDVYDIVTFANGPGGRCTKNAISLGFIRHR
jgi:tetratricopeptide (TPR) repeat protein